MKYLLLIPFLAACTYKGCVHLPSEGVEVTLSDTLVTINDRLFPVYSVVHKRTYSEYDTEEYSIVANGDYETGGNGMYVYTVELYDHVGVLKCVIIQ